MAENRGEINYKDRVGRYTIGYECTLKADKMIVAVWMDEWIRDGMRVHASEDPSPFARVPAKDWVKPDA